MSDATKDKRLRELDDLVTEMLEKVRRMTSGLAFDLYQCDSESGLDAADFDKMANEVVELKRCRDHLRELRQQQATWKRP
jgi:hypothetical protein